MKLNRGIENKYLMNLQIFSFFSFKAQLNLILIKS